MSKPVIDYSSGEMTINYDSLVYKPGDRVNGWATVQLKVDLPSPRATLIVATAEHLHYPLVVHGKDESEQDGQFERWQSYQHPYFFASFPIELPASDVLPAGNYVIPFTLQLKPESIQSFSHEWLQAGQQCYLRVSHKVYFLLENAKTNSLIFKKERFYVYDFDRVVLPLSQTQRVDFQVELKKRIWGNNGSFSFSLEVDKAEYKKGEMVRVRADLDLTKLKLKVVKIGCILAQNVNMNGKAAVWPSEPTKVVYKPATYSEVVSIRFQEAGPNITFAGHQNLTFDLPVDSHFDYANEYGCDTFRCQHVVELILYFQEKPYVWTDHLKCLPVQISQSDNMLEVSNTKGPAITKAVILKKAVLEGPGDLANNRKIYERLEELQHKKKGYFH